MNKMDKELTMKINREIIDDDELLELINERCEESEDYADGFVDGAISGARWCDQGYERGLNKVVYAALGALVLTGIVYCGLKIYDHIQEKKQKEVTQND